MRPKLVAVLAAVTLAVIVPRPSSGGGTILTKDVPDVSVAIRVPTTTAKAIREPPHTVAPKTVQRDAEPPARVAAPVEQERAGLVREWHVLYAQSAGEEREPSSATPCPRASTCESYELRPARWPTDDGGRAVIPFSYNDEGRRRARAPDGQLIPALRASMSEWSRWNSNIVFQDQGTTTARFAADGADGTCDDGTNVVTWEKFDREVIGAAVLCFDKTGKVIRDADLALNSTQHWETVSGEPESRHSHDIQSILTHELGHWLALEDLYSGTDARQTMFGNTAYGETRKRTLARGDALGIQKAYPCGSGDRCPREGFKED